MKNQLNMAATGNFRQFSISGLLAFSDDPEPLKYIPEDPEDPEELVNDPKKTLKAPKLRVC